MRTLVILLLTALLAALASTVPLLQPLALSVALLAVLIGVSRFELPGLVIAFLVATHLAQFLKRAIFLLGPQPQDVYFAIQFLPTVVLGFTLVSAVRRGRALPASGRLLSAFIALTLAVTALSLSDLPDASTLAAIHQQVLPYLMFFVGLSVTLSEFGAIGRTMAALATVSVAYGIFQLAAGPTVVDELWAAGTYAYSLHGSKVFNYLQGVTPQFRAYSYYADPLTWGLVLVAGFVGAAVARARGQMRKASWAAMVAVVLAGLFASLTRTCWVSFLGTVGVYLALRYRPVRRPWVVFGLVIGTFAVAISGATMLYEELFLARRLPIVQNPLVARYITVGTLEARISAWDTLKETIATKPQGYGVMPPDRKRLEAPDWNRLLFHSHNFIVDLVLNSGVLGACLFLLFYFQWLRESFSVFRTTRDTQAHQAICWMVAFSAGSMMSGYMNGLTFASYEYFLVMGALAGSVTSARAAIRQEAPLEGAAGRWALARPALVGR